MTKDLDLHEPRNEHLAEDLPSDAPEDLRRVAATNKAKFEGNVRGAKARAEMLPRSGINGLAFGVSHKMLMLIINGDLTPKTAKEAADVAKIAHELGRKETGEGDGIVRIMNADERTAAIKQIAEMRSNAAARALEAGQVEAANLEVEIEDAEVVEDEILEGIRAGLVPRSTEGAPALRRVRVDSPTS